MTYRFLSDQFHQGANDLCVKDGSCWDFNKSTCHKPGLHDNFFGTVPV